MDLVSNVVALLAMQAGIGAPPDVPKGHWAYGAVDDLFKQGILHGYPSTKKPLAYDRSVKRDTVFIDRRLKDWKGRGLLVGYPDGRGNRTLGDYERAVAAHAVYSNICEGPSYVSAAYNVDELEDLVKVFSMLMPELRLMGADVDECLRRMNRARGFAPVTFLGNR
jgi:hypothetical protein